MFKQKSFHKQMAYRSSINQRNLSQIFYGNTTITTDTANPNSPATVFYVQTQIAPINTQITNLNNTANSLQASILALQNQAALIEAQLPNIVGSIVMVMSNDVPPYTLLCDGSSVSTTTYADLFSVIGYNYGGSGANFNIPNFQSYFLIGGNNNVNGVARGDGEDAIRTCIVWQDPKTNLFTPISKSTRVNRTGEMEEIVERTLQRGRDLFSTLPSVQKCNCGAPKAVSKAGNLYCAARCWIK